MSSIDPGREPRRSIKNEASLSGDKSSKSQTDYSDSKLNYPSGGNIDIKSTLKHLDMENPYRCTFPGCNTSWSSQDEWRVHEEGHWTPKCYICLFCATPRKDSTGNRCCVGCSYTFHSRFDTGVAGSHILQCELARERTQKFESYYRLCVHLRKEHDVKTFDLQGAECSFPVVSNWPRKCEFCDTKFIQWDERQDHIAAHFLQADQLSEDPPQFSHVVSIDRSGIAKHHTSRCSPRDAWNTICMSRQEVHNATIEAFASHIGIEMMFPKDCPVVVTDTAVEHCSCNGTLPITFSTRNRLQYISRALHISRTKLLSRATGEWLFFTLEFQQWRNLREHAFLWLRGSTGSGKSLLTSAIIRRLEEEDKRNGEVIAYYCCDGRYDKLHTVLNIMKTWLAELHTQSVSNSVVGRLMESVIYLENAHEELSLAALRRAFQAIKHSLREEESLILVLDGLDDYQIGYDLLQEVLRLTNKHGNYHRVKILLSSRTDFTKADRNFAPLQVNIDTGTSIVEDMKDYTENLVSKSMVSQGAMMTIWNCTEKSQGRFLCLRLLLLIFTYDSTSADAIRWVLSIADDEIITGPVAIYSHIFESIPKHYQQFAISMARWVLHAARPMYSWELLDVVNSELGTDYLEADIKKATMGLLSISRSRTVNLVHLSLRDYFMSIEGNPYTGKTQEMITEACLKALHPMDLIQSLRQPWSDDYAIDTQPPKQSKILGVYAKTYWIHHYLIAEPQSTRAAGLLHETLSKILSARKAALPNNPNPKSDASKTLLEIEVGRLIPVSRGTVNLLLQIGASFGFYELAKLELDMGATVNNFPKNPLRLAVMAGKTNLVKLLLNYGADINFCDDLDDTLLLQAIEGGYYEIASLLIEAEACQTAEISRPVGAMDELRLVPIASKMHCGCGEIKITFMITKDTTSNTSEETTSPILIKENIYLPPSPNKNLTDGGDINDTTTIKWFPGTGMYNALALAANLGIDHVREILLVAGNTLDPFEKMVSLLSQDFAIIAIA